VATGSQGKEQEAKEMSDKIQIIVHGASPGGDVVPLASREARGLISRHGQVRQCHVVIDGSAHDGRDGQAWVVRIILSMPECTLTSRTKVAVITDPAAEAEAMGRAFEEAESLLDNYEERACTPKGSARPLHSF